MGLLGRCAAAVRKRGSRPALPLKGGCGGTGAVHRLGGGLCYLSLTRLWSN